MNKAFATILLIFFLLTACSTPNAATDEVSIPQQATQTTNSEGSKQVRPDRTKDEDTPEGIARFELNEAFRSLLDEINAKHEVVKVYNEEYEQYLVQNKEPGFNFSDYVTYGPTVLPDGSDILTLEQVEEDMDILYKTLRTQYGAYSYFGGDEVFRAAADAVVEGCAVLDRVTVSALYNSVMKHFGFLKDQHFEINGNGIAEQKYVLPFFFRAVSYNKTETGYETPDGKVVATVDGYEDLDDLFRRSLTKEGDLVWYPILLVPSENPRGGKTVCSTVLTVRYTDGSTDTLTADEYYLQSAGGYQVDVREQSGIPVVTPHSFDAGSSGLKFIKSASDYKDRDIVIMDLRFCSGGNMATIESWLNTYASRIVWENSLSLIAGSTTEPLWEYAVTHPEEEIASVDSVCIMLSSKSSMSAAEWMIDCGWNMENTLIVGENTSGGFTAYGRYTITLPNSGVFVSFGPSLALHPEGHFEEYRGYYPDIWCPADEAKEAVMNFIEKNTAVTYEEIQSTTE